jgi:hypothetical protein
LTLPRYDLNEWESITSHGIVKWFDVFSVAWRLAQVPPPTTACLCAVHARCHRCGTLPHNTMRGTHEIMVDTSDQARYDALVFCSTVLLMLPLPHVVIA